MAPFCCLGGKVIVFAHHIAVLDGIQAKLGKAFQAVRIDGSTNMANRKQAMDDFQQKSHVKLAILSISAAGVSSTTDSARAHVEGVCCSQPLPLPTPLSSPHMQAARVAQDTPGRA